jgi:hypothetical protein
MDIIERTKEVIRKAKAILPLIKSVAVASIQGMEDALALVIKTPTPCPPEIAQGLDEAFSLIEQLYEETALN